MSSEEAKDQPTDIINLQVNFSKQQEKISALKELVRKSEVAHGRSTSSAQERVRNIAEQLTLLKTKAHSRQNLSTSQMDESADTNETRDGENVTRSSTSLQFSSESITSPSASNISTPNPTPMKVQYPPAPASAPDVTPSPNASSSGSEKFQLLRQQMEQNKVRMAQRASSKQHLEQIVLQLKEKFDTTQQCLESTSEMGKSMSDLSALGYGAGTKERHKSATDLASQPFNLERERIKFLENRCRLMEKQLEKERQSNAASFSEKQGENKIAELEVLLSKTNAELNEKTANERKLEEEIERLSREVTERREEVERLKLSVTHGVVETDDNKLADLMEEYKLVQQELSEKSARIAELEEVNDILDTNCRDLTARNRELEEQVGKMQSELAIIDEELVSCREALRRSEEKWMALKGEQENTDAAEATPSSAPADTETQVKAEMAKQIKNLQETVDELTEKNATLRREIDEAAKLEVSDKNIAEKIASLEATIESQREDLKNRGDSLSKCEEELMEKTIELNVLQANFKVLENKLQASIKSKPLFSSAGGAGGAENAELQAEINSLKQKLDESNKAMIKLKLKCKQSEKQVEKLKKSSDLHAEVLRLEKANEELLHKVTELEDEKGQWQLTQIDEIKSTEGDSSQQTVEQEEELVKKCNTQSETIRLLEDQKYDLNKKVTSLEENLKNVQEKLNNQENVERVKSEISQIHMEEQLEEHGKLVQSLEAQLATKAMEVDDFAHRLDEATKEKEAIAKRLEHYIAENIELLDKVEKLSKSSSSAESIEIVERLTQQERAELDEMSKQMEQPAPVVSELTQTDMNPELSESLMKLREESSELMNKIELFTAERREVLEKMETLSGENQELARKIGEVIEERDSMEADLLLAVNEKSNLEARLQEVAKEKERLASQVAESTAQQDQLSQELTSLQKSSEVVAALDSNDAATLFDKCEKSLSKLNSELEAYRKADRNAKLNVSKKLAKEAKNAYTQLSELLQKVKEASHAVETVTVVETVVAVTAPNGKALAEYEQLTAQNRELKSAVEELRSKLREAREYAEENVPEEEVIVPALTQARDEEAIVKLAEYEKECSALRGTVETLRLELAEERRAGEEKDAKVAHLSAEVFDLRKMSDDFDRVMNDKEMSFEKQIEQLTRLRKELEGKCETYEGEIEILQTLIREQKQQLIEAYKENEHEMNLKLLDLQQSDEIIKALRAEVKALKDASQATGEKSSKDLETECEKLRESLRISKALVAEQLDEISNKQETIDSLSQQISDLYTSMEENVNKVIEKEDEIIRLQELVETNSRSLERLRKDNDEQKSVVDKLLSELHSHKLSTQHLPQLESNLQRLTVENARLQDTMKTLQHQNKEQLEKLKKYAANLKKRTAQCQELEAKIKGYEKGALEEMQSKENDTEIQELTANNVLLNERIGEMELSLKETKATADELQEALRSKTAELLDDKEIIGNLKRQLEQRENELIKNDSDIRTTKQELARVYERLEQSLQEAMEKDQLLQQKNASISALENDLAAMSEKYIAQGQQMELLSEELKAKALKFEKSKAVIKERNGQIHRLQAQLKDLQDKLVAQPEEESVIDTPIVQQSLESSPAMPAPSQQEFEALQKSYALLGETYASEKANFEQTISRLENLYESLQAKLQEDMAYIESIEAENCSYKEKICKMQEGIAQLEERRASIESRANLLNAQMQSREDEHEKAEDELVDRLNALSKHDEIIGQRLLDAQEERAETQQRMEQLQAELDIVKAKHAILEKEAASRESAYQSLEAENSGLREKLKGIESDHQRLQVAYEARLAAKTTEMDELESELSVQLETMNAEKRSLLESLERSRDECSELKDENLRLKETLNAADQARHELERESTWLRMQSENAQQDQQELQELRMQSVQDKGEIDSLRHQIELLTADHDLEMQGLRLQISELDSLRMQVGQNQTDDQVFIESENKRLTDLLAEKEALIENYQRQNLQLQVAAAAAAASSTDRNDPQGAMGLVELQHERSREVPVCDVIAAPHVFFTSEQVAPSPFDDIVHLHAAAVDGVEQPTIEDLQRNVSDLEKHAQDLENKLASRNQREAEVEIQFGEWQRKLQDAESRVRDRDERLQRASEEILSAQQELANFSTRVQQLEQQLKDREEQLQRRDDEAITALEQQIIPIDIAEASVNNDAGKAAPPSLTMFFSDSTSPEFENLIVPPSTSEPVVEEIIVPRKAYVCQPTTESVAEKSATAFDDFNSGWDDHWDGQEVVAEAEHFAATAALPGQASQSLLSRERHLEIQLQEEIERSQELRASLERSEQQRQELQGKTAKAMKKLKEYKLKIEELQVASHATKSPSVESSNMFDDLDAAIQEELKTQIAVLEAKLGEELKAKESLLAEKDKLLKRVDVLTAGNERMSEMKERQDMDVQMYQARIRDLQDKLNSLEEWGTEAAPTEGSARKNETAVESERQDEFFRLTKEITDINNDRQELQAILEDEKSNAQRAEETARGLQLRVAALEADLEAFQARDVEQQEVNRRLQGELSELRQQLEKSQNDESRLRILLAEEEKKREELQRENDELKGTVYRLEEELGELQSQLLVERTQNAELLQAKVELQTPIAEEKIVNDLELRLQTLLNETEQLRQQKEAAEKRLADMEAMVQLSKHQQSSDELTAQLQEKESEIMHLKQRIEDLMREDQTEKLVLEILTKNQDIHMLKMQVKHLEEDKLELEHNLTAQITRDMQSDQLQESQAENATLRKQIEVLERQVSELSDEKQNMEEELKVLNNHVIGSLEQEEKMKTVALELDAKNIEIVELRQSLETLKSTSASASTNVIAADQKSVDFIALNAEWEAIVEQRCGEIAQMWRNHLDAREEEFKASESRLQEEIRSLRSQLHGGQKISAESSATSTAASDSISESGNSSPAVSKDGTPLRRPIIDETADPNALIEKMQSALENQEMEIVTLKEQLAIRSAEYARLAAQHDPFKIQTTLSHSGLSAVSTSPGPSSLPAAGPRGSGPTQDAAAVPKSELDLALYMLHQRDMRCEEMTLELVALLEERDTLQLKLSDTLRQVEAIKAQTNFVESGGIADPEGRTMATSSTDIAAKPAGANATAGDASYKLSQKLSQLQTVDHSKDKIIKEEREQRIRQMEKLQQDVARMPTAAVSELIGSDFSQSNQSPSSALLNWLWGNKPGSDGGSPSSS